MRRVQSSVSVLIEFCCYAWRLRVRIIQSPARITKQCRWRRWKDALWRWPHTCAHSRVCHTGPYVDSPTHPHAESIHRPDATSSACSAHGTTSRPIRLKLRGYANCASVWLPNTVHGRAAVWIWWPAAAATVWNESCSRSSDSKLGKRGQLDTWGRRSLVAFGWFVLSFVFASLEL